MSKIEQKEITLEPVDTRVEFFEHPPVIERGETALIKLERDGETILTLQLPVATDAVLVDTICVTCIPVVRVNK